MIAQRSILAFRQLTRQSRTFTPLVGRRIGSTAGGATDNTKAKLGFQFNPKGVPVKLWPMGTVVFAGLLGTGFAISHHSYSKGDYVIEDIKKSSIPDATRKALDEIEGSFFLSEEKLRAIEEKFIADFRNGYSTYNKAMAMIPTFVTRVPDGTETGTFLAVDLGGTNLRVCEVVLHGNGNFDLQSKMFEVSRDLKTGTATALFDYIAKCVGDFLSELHHLARAKGDVLSLGFTFSFPVEQTALGKGTLLTWTKGYLATGAVGNDVVQLLQDALDRQNLPVKCTALVNDTAGTLLSHAYATGGCLLGAIFGTGTNGAFVDKTASFTKLGDSLSTIDSDIMIVNTEWGAFDNERGVLPVTPFDNKLDRESINPRFQCFEKFISGMYLGEITRNILLYLIDKNMLFSGHSTPKLNLHYGLDTKIMSDVESDRSAELSIVRKTLINELNVDDKLIQQSDLEIVRWVCQCVGTRAALLSGVALAATIKQTESKPPIHVGIDGSLFEHYPNFEERLRKSLRVLVGQDIEEQVEIKHAKDGSGVGAALCAMLANKHGSKP
ncbi:glucokinase [Ceratobasidium sp. 392]|nr:glucokinase [Ceratobasidium sp. 392]